MNSLTMTSQADAPGRRHGRSRADAAYHSRTWASSGGSEGVIRSILARRAAPGPVGFAPSIAGMDGNPLLNPVGSLPPEVYWRRRAMAAVLAILVGWFVWTEFNGHGGANAAPAPKKSSTVTPAPTTTSPTPTHTPAPAVTKAKAKPKTAKHKVTVASTRTAAPTAAATARCPSSAIKLTV